MKALLINGSPRKGNTCTALEALKKGLKNIADLDIKEVKANDLRVSPCIACDSCRTDNQCVFDDDTNEIVNAVIEADIIVFATPVYWWGMSAQMKLIIDKFYSQVQNLSELAKKVGVIVIGEAAQDDTQYEIIPRQFKCICDYLGWDMVFSKTYTAGDAEELAKSEIAVKEIESLWQTIQ